MRGRGITLNRRRIASISCRHRSSWNRCRYAAWNAGGMMEARYLILARYAEFTNDGFLNIIGGDQDKIVSDDYPYAHSMIIAAARLVLEREDCSVEHAFKSIIVDSETGELVAEGASGTIPA